MQANIFNHVKEAKISSQANEKVVVWDEIFCVDATDETKIEVVVSVFVDDIPFPFSIADFRFHHAAETIAQIQSCFKS